MAVPRYYEPSGKFSPVGLLIALMTAPVGAAVISVIYAYAIIYIPIAGTVSFLLGIGAGFGIGFACNLLIKAGKIRNSTVTFFVGTVAALFGFFVHWAVWIWCACACAFGVDLAWIWCGFGVGWGRLASGMFLSRWWQTISMSKCSSTVFTVKGRVGLVEEGITFGSEQHLIMSGACPPPAPSQW